MENAESDPGTGGLCSGAATAPLAGSGLAPTARPVRRAAGPLQLSPAFSQLRLWDGSGGLKMAWTRPIQLSANLGLGQSPSQQESPSNAIGLFCA